MTAEFSPTSLPIAVLGGTGAQGFGLAARWASAGFPVTIGSRDAARAQTAAQQIHAAILAHCAQPPAIDVRGLENVAAVHDAAVVVIAVPFSAQAETIKTVRKDLRAGQIVIDLTVPLASAVGGRATRMLGVPQGSAAEQAAELLPVGVRVVGAFHNVSASALAHLGSPVECDVVCCGGDAAAKAAVSHLVCAIPGLRPVDGGPLESARAIEAITALLIGLNIRYKVHDSGFRFTGLPLDL